MTHMCAHQLYFKDHAPCGIYCKKCPGVKFYNCKGCREQPGCSIPHEDCATLKCVHQKSLDFCHECGEFPCSLLQPCADGAQRYPYNFKLYNLCRIQRIGLQIWAEDEAAEIRKRYYNGRFVIGRGPVLKESHPKS